MGFVDTETYYRNLLQSAMYFRGIWHRTLIERVLAYLDDGALGDILATIVNDDSTDVDSLTGATMTSTGAKQSRMP